jgi:hypothetical protein
MFTPPTRKRARAHDHAHTRNHRHDALGHTHAHTHAHTHTHTHTHTHAQFGDWVPPPSGHGFIGDAKAPTEFTAGFSQINDIAHMVELAQRVR